MLQSDMATEIEAEAPAQKHYILNASHLCDACGWPACYRLTMDNEAATEWLLCLHHFQTHSEKLLPNALEVLDESSRLSERH